MGVSLSSLKRVGRYRQRFRSRSADEEFLWFFFVSRRTSSSCCYAKNSSRPHSCDVWSGTAPPSSTWLIDLMLSGSVKWNPIVQRHLQCLSMAQFMSQEEDTATRKNHDNKINPAAISLPSSYQEHRKHANRKQRPPMPNGGRKATKLRYSGRSALARVRPGLPRQQGHHAPSKLVTKVNNSYVKRANNSGSSFESQSGFLRYLVRKSNYRSSSINCSSHRTAPSP